MTRSVPPDEAGTASSVETTSEHAMTRSPRLHPGLPSRPLPARPTGEILGPVKDPLAPVTEAVPPLVEDVLEPVQGHPDPGRPAGARREPPAPVQGALEDVDDVLDGVVPGLGLGSLLPASRRRSRAEPVAARRLTESPDVRPRALLVVLAAGVALAAAPAAAADLADETALAEKYAPVVRLVEQTEECGPGEPYVPTDVDVLFGDPTVALRGPWNAFDLVKIGPAADDLAGLYEYHLDFPGNALDPGCTYELWARRLTEGSEPAVYAHVVSEPATREGGAAVLVLLPLQRLQQHARGRLGDDPARLRRGRRARSARDEPTSVGYSSHEGAERADWTDDEKLDRVGTHPVVYPAAGSHANKFTGRAVPRQLGRGGRRLRRHPRSAPRAAAEREDDPERRGGGAATRSRGSRSRGAGASSRRRSTTGRPART